MATGILSVMDLFAMTLNGIAGNAMFAVLFGTLGYKENQVIGMTSSDLFIAENMDALAADVANRDGEYLDTLAFLMNVSDVAAFKSLVQQNFDSIYSTPDVTSVEVSAKIKSFI